jgi:hypothetical protein
MFDLQRISCCFFGKERELGMFQLLNWEAAGVDDDLTTNRRVLYSAAGHLYTCKLTRGKRNSKTATALGIHFVEVKVSN